MHAALARERLETRPQAARRDGGAVGPRLEHGVVALGDELEQPLLERRIRLGRRDRGVRLIGIRHPIEQQDAVAQPSADVGDDALGVGARAVDLVHEHDDRQAEAFEGAHEHDGLRLHALDRRDDEHRAVEHGERPLDLGDEVRVAGGVDEVDAELADAERGDRRADGDAPAPLEVEGIGEGGAVVDAAEAVDHARFEEQAFSE